MIGQSDSHTYSIFGQTDNWNYSISGWFTDRNYGTSGRQTYIISGLLADQKYGCPADQPANTMAGKHHSDRPDIPYYQSEILQMWPFCWPRIS